MLVSHCSGQELKAGLDLQVLLSVTVVIQRMPVREHGLCPDAPAVVR